MDSARYSAVGDLPTEVYCSKLYDGDVVQEPDGRCLTVFQQWHGQFGVTTRCLTGAFLLENANGFGYSDPVIEFGEEEKLVLVGTLGGGESLSLRPLPGQPNHSRKISAHSVRNVKEDDRVIAADGLAYVVVKVAGKLVMHPLWVGAHQPRFRGVEVDTYLRMVLPEQLNFVVIND